LFNVTFDEGRKGSNMKNSFRLFCLGATVFAGLTLVSFTARATATVTDPVLAPAGVNTMFTYFANLDNGQIGAGSPAPYDGQIVIFDFGGYVPGSIFAPAGWVATVQLTGGSGTPYTGIDDPTITNLVFNYTGPLVADPSTPGSTPLGGFGALSHFSGTYVPGNFDYSSGDQTPAGANSFSGGTVALPAAVPDGGTTVSLLGIVLVGVEALRRKLART
jgi:hypothetical protein